MIDERLHRGVNDGEGRHGQQHAHEAEQAAAHDDGEHDPEAVDADGAAEDLGADDVAVELLQNENDDGEDQRLHGRDEQDDDAGRDRAVLQILRAREQLLAVRAVGEAPAALRVEKYLQQPVSERRSARQMLRSEGGFVK